MNNIPSSGQPADNDEARGPLNRDLITDAAIALLDEVGFEKLSTRRLATRLGIQSASLYWHFRNKDALLDAMSARLYMTHIPEPKEPTRGFDWAGWLADGARGIRSAALGTRDGSRIMIRSREDDPETQQRIARNAGVLQRYGFTEEEAHSALRTLRRFTIGFALQEQYVVKNEQAMPGLGGAALFDFSLDLIIQSLKKKVADRETDLPES